jgi:hypothetical protein
MTFHWLSMTVPTLRPSKWPIPGPIFVLSLRFTPGIFHRGVNFLHWPIWPPKLLWLFFRWLLILRPAHARVCRAGVCYPSFLPLPSQLHQAAQIPLPYPILPSLYWPFLRADSPRWVVSPTLAHTAPTPTVSMLPPLLGGVGLISWLLIIKGGDFIRIVPIRNFLLQLMGGFLLTPLMGGFLLQLMGGILLMPLMGDSSFSSWGPSYSRPPSPWGGLLFVGIYCQVLVHVNAPWWHSAQIAFLHAWWWCFGPYHPFLLSPCTKISVTILIS